MTEPHPSPLSSSSSSSNNNKRTKTNDATTTIYENLNALDSAWTDRATPIFFRFPKPIHGGGGVGINKTSKDQIVQAQLALSDALQHDVPQFGGWLEKNPETNRWCLGYDTSQPPLHSTCIIEFENESNNLLQNHKDWAIRIQQHPIVIKAMEELKVYLFDVRTVELPSFPFKPVNSTTTTTTTTITSNTPPPTKAFPLLGACFILFRDSGEWVVFIRYNHVIGDAFVARTLMEAWSRSYSKITSTTLLNNYSVNTTTSMMIPRTILDTIGNNNNNNNGITITTNKKDSYPIQVNYGLNRANIFKIWDEYKSKGGPLTSMRIEFPTPFLELLKLKAKNEGRITPRRLPSSNDVLCAIFWKWVSTDVMRPHLQPGSHLDRTQPLFLLFNFRSRLIELPITAEMIGNAAFSVTVPATRQQLKEWDLSQLVDAIQAIATAPEDIVREWARHVYDVIGHDPTDGDYLSRAIRFENNELLCGDGMCITNWTVLDWQRSLQFDGIPPIDVGTMCGGDAGLGFARFLAMCPKSAGICAYTRVPQAGAVKWIELQNQGGLEEVCTWLGIL
jgi:hypothetical protein